MKHYLALAALLVAAPALAQETPRDRAERILAENPCAFLPGESTEECAAFGREAPAWQWGTLGEELYGQPLPEAFGLEAEAPPPALTLRQGDPVYFADLGFQPCQLGRAGRSLASVFARPGATGFGGQLDLSAPGVCDALRQSNLVGCGSLHDPWREPCGSHGQTVWLWQCSGTRGSWQLGGGRCGPGSIGQAFQAVFGRPMQPGLSEERLAALASCGVLIPGCAQPGCPGPRPTLPPSPDPCVVPPEPEPPTEPQPPEEPPTEPPAPARMVVEVDDCCDGGFRGRRVMIPDGAIEPWEGNDRQRSVLSTGRLDLVEVELRGVACRRPCPLPEEPWPDTEVTILGCEARGWRVRIAPEGEEPSERVIPVGTEALLEAHTSIMLPPCPAECPACEPCEEPEPPEPEPEPPTGEHVLSIPGAFHRPQPGALAYTARLRLPRGTYTYARLKYSLRLERVSPQRQQAHWWAVDGRYKSGVPGFVFFMGQPWDRGPGGWTLRNGGRGDSAGAGTRFPFRVSTSDLELRIVQVYDAAAGYTRVEVYDAEGTLRGHVTSRQKVQTLQVDRELVAVLGYDTERWPNPQEAPTQGVYSDLVMEVRP